MRDWLAGARRGVDLPLREAARGRDVRRRADVPRDVGVHDRRRLRAEHDDPQRVRAEHGLRDGARAASSRSARSSRRTWAATRRSRTATSSAAGTERRCVAEVTLTEEAVRRVLRTTVDDLLELVVGGDARRGRVRDAVGRVHAGDGDRRDLRRDGAGPGHGRHQLDGARHREARRGRAERRDPAARASRSARSAAGRPSPTPAPGSG